MDGKRWNDGGIDEWWMTMSWFFALHKILAGGAECSARTAVWEESELNLGRDGDRLRLQGGDNEDFCWPITVDLWDFSRDLKTKLAIILRQIPSSTVRSSRRPAVCWSDSRVSDRRPSRRWGIWAADCAVRGRTGSRIIEPTFGTVEGGWAEAGPPTLPDDTRCLSFNSDRMKGVHMSSKEPKECQGGCLPCAGIETRDWYAWLNLMPPKPDDFHVIGEVYVPNPGVDPFLTPRVPQGLNPEILLLDLHLIQRPGNWPQVFVWKPARYDKVPSSVHYTQVQIFCGDEVIADIKVEEVH